MYVMGEILIHIKHHTKIVTLIRICHILGQAYLFQNSFDYDKDN